jgi:hypothetical protein
VGKKVPHKEKGSRGSAKKKGSRGSAKKKGSRGSAEWRVQTKQLPATNFIVP